MNEVFCIFYDEEIDQDLPLQPENIEEAISVFRKFNWRNEKEESAMKLLFFQSTHASNPNLYISCLEKDKWCVDTSIKKRRRFMGPFFRKSIHRNFFDQNEIEIEKIIRIFCISSPDEFTALLETNESGMAFSY